LAVGRQHARAGAWEQAEQVYRAAVTRMAEEAAGDGRAEIQRQLALALKRQARHADAAEVWEQLADGDGEIAVEALTELAKHYEWRDDPQIAVRQRLCACPATPPPASPCHRVARLSVRDAIQQ
jgi:hypothetical protein